ncbi:hypothetical protein GP486_001392 [Trichoglossum hirsutum]|uniref:Flavin dependent monooxygenase n=1 Tax=Trichoglossum hirsutum TaxID=265104 RepID=A0A9P8LH85_9PEZI|nr:hypothetical protein GP486_001392 [Trichoglossum hirsutum]
MDATKPYNIRKIAIIGAGPSGLATAKYLLAEHSFSQIDIFEQRSTVGGVWNFSPETSRVTKPQTSPYGPVEEPQGSRDGELIFPSPMYMALETNIPHDLMKFTDLPFPRGTQLFPPHEVVKQYVEEYANDVRHLINFSTQVLDVRPLGSHDSSEVSCHEVWRVKTRKSGSQLEKLQDYDAIVVASGHYSVPFVPDIRGLAEWNEDYPGAVTHSISYRRPDHFRGKKVIIIGNAASGTDIGSQIAVVCAHPLLVSQRNPSDFLSDSGTEARRKEVPEVVAFLPPSEGYRAVQFANNHVETEVDAVIFCTGYLYSHPYLSCLNLSPQTPDGIRMQHAYRHIFFTPRPTLAFVGLLQKVIPFQVAESQAAAIARVWSNRISLPSKAEMDRWEEQEIAMKGAGRKFHIMGFPLDANYINEIHAWCLQAELGTKSEKLPPLWGGKERWIRERFHIIRKAYSDRGAARHRVKSMEELGFDYKKWKGEEEQAAKGSLQGQDEKATNA